jgi:hypothetical protein
MPLIVQHRPSIPPAIILHVFCKVAAAISSSHVQVIFMPPAHFSIFIVQRGTMHMLGMIADMLGIWPIIGIELDMPMVVPTTPRSIIIALDITTLLCHVGASKRGAAKNSQTVDRRSRTAPRLAGVPLACPVGNVDRQMIASR